MLVRKVELANGNNDKDVDMGWSYMQKKGETREERARARTEK